VVVTVTVVTIEVTVVVTVVTRSAALGARDWPVLRGAKTLSVSKGEKPVSTYRTELFVAFVCVTVTTRW
jgi:hypothetical protein